MIYISVGGGVIGYKYDNKSIKKFLNSKFKKKLKYVLLIKTYQMFQVV